MRCFLLLVTLSAYYPLVALAQGAHYDNSPSDMTGGGVVSGDLILSCTSCPFELSMDPRTTDVAKMGLLIGADDAWPGSAVNTAGGNIYLSPGIGSRIITVTNYTLAAGDSVTIEVSTPTASYTSTTLTEGVGFSCITSNDVCATALASAVGALTGLSAVADGAVVRIFPDDTTYMVNTVTPADGGVDGVFATQTSGVGGQVFVPPGRIANPGLVIGPNAGTGISSGSTSGSSISGAALNFITVGFQRLVLNSIGLQLFVPINALNAGVYSSSRSLILGSTVCTTSHGLDTGSTCNNGHLEVNGDIYLDGIASDVGATCTTGEFRFDTGGATRELCYCRTTNTWACTPMTDGPAD